MAYLFYLGNTLLPVSPSKLTTSMKNQNKTVNLINLSEVNILRTPGLTEIKFDALLPNVRYPFAVYKDGFKDATYFVEILEAYKKSKKPFQFIISRKSDVGKVFAYTNIKVSLENFEISESANDGFDMTASISLKQYVEYNSKTAQIKNSTKEIANVFTTVGRTSKDPSNSYEVKEGDTLWSIAKLIYGLGDDWKTIYEANKSVIEAVAKENGRESSSNGWWIYPGTKLAIP